MLSIFLCGCWSSVCLLWRNVYSDPLSPFNCLTLLLVCLFVQFLSFFFFFDDELYAFFVYFLYKLLIGQIVYKHLVPLSRLPFYLADKFPLLFNQFAKKKKKKACKNFLVWYNPTSLFLLLVPLPVGVSHSFMSDSVTPWTPLPMEFSRQDNWSGLPFPYLWRHPKKYC